MVLMAPITSYHLSPTNTAAYIYSHTSTSRISLARKALFKKASLNKGFPCKLVTSCWCVAISP